MIFPSYKRDRRIDKTRACETEGDRQRERRPVKPFFAFLSQGRCLCCKYCPAKIRYLSRDGNSKRPSEMGSTDGQELPYGSVYVLCIASLTVLGKCWVLRVGSLVFRGWFRGYWEAKSENHSRGGL